MNHFAPSALRSFARVVTCVQSYVPPKAIKVAYNTYISMKIVFANTWMEICHQIPGTDVDAVTDALSFATKRIISPKYLAGGTQGGARALMPSMVR